MPVIGMLRWGTPATAADELPAFLKGLSDAGYVEGQNVTIEYRWSGSQNELLPVLAEELVRRRVNELVTQTTPAALAAKAATVTIPILFSVGADPVKLGLVRSYNLSPAVTLLVSARSTTFWLLSNSRCCMNWCPRPLR